MEVVFKKASYRNRLFAFAIDLFLMIVTTLGLMGIAYLITSNMDYYKNANQAINDLQMKSHLYVERSDGNYQLMCDYYKITQDSDYEKYANQFDEALTEFYSDPDFFDQSNPLSGMYLYNTQKIPADKTASDLFIYEDETHSNIIPRDGATQEQLYKFYCGVMENQAYSYLVKHDTYINSSRIINLNFFLVDLLIPIVLSTIIYELIIPLSLRRGKKTIGKLLLKLSVVDVRGLSCPWYRYLLRFTILLFLEIILSIPGILIPIVVSFTMTVFSKRGQALHDYITNTYVIEAPMSSICLNEEEYLKKHEKDEQFSLSKEEVVL